MEAIFEEHDEINIKLISENNLKLFFLRVITGILFV